MTALPFDFSLAVAFLAFFVVSLFFWARRRTDPSKRGKKMNQEERGFLFYSELVLEVVMMAAICAALAAGFKFVFL
ncbi:hypothetical protein [Denitromonas sp.]|uniref:hypothetical protein n=1 Tax=Denitromonas sp. TaxID=2734609 RepID=UPI002AFF5AF6|nr:hypothetical protein [Denitromonas sp.]